jgi:polyvinyl alcohol dehydrogenase (cytochrome)
VTAGADSGFGTFQTRCMTCHGKPNMERAPSPAALREFPPEKILDILNTSATHQAMNLTGDQKRRAAEAIGYRLVGSAVSGDAKTMPNRCATSSPMADPAAGPAWNGWGVDISNTRFQPAKAAGLTADQLPRLKLKWAFGFPGGASAYGQPTVVSGRVFVGADTGWVYSLDAASGCVYWSFMTKASMRNAITIAPVKGRGPVRYGAFFGDLKNNVYGLDAQNGQLLWTTKVDDNYTARVTGAPTVYDGRLYIGTAKWEANTARDLNYPCCTARGSVTSLDVNTGKPYWKHYVIEEEPKPTRKNSIGTQLYGPSGGSVWTAPTIDPKRGVIYVGSGEATSEPAADTSDSILALDIKTGKLVWHYQAFKDDAYILGCSGSTKTENCPDRVGPDYDFGNSPILKTLPNGKRLLIAGMKEGTIIAVDPDQKGALVWKVNVSSNPLSGIVWGGAADDQNVYYGLTGGGMAAVQLATGEKVWFSPLSAADGRNARSGNGAATSAIPGAAFVGGKDGILHAVSTKDGRNLWEFDTAREFPTVNRVAAHGGSMIAPGATVAGGMVFVGSGYGVFGDRPGNVLLALSVE